MNRDVEAAIVALIVAGASVLGQWLLKRQDYARQDAVAAQAARAADLLLAANERVARQTADADRATQGQLREIHTLVDGNLTAAFRAELLATKLQRSAMKEIIDLNRKAGREPGPEAVAALDTVDRRIAELDASLKDRLTQTRVADAQAADGQAAGRWPR